jgi:hypothetical protein
MVYVIAREALHRFVEHQIQVIETTPLPADLRAVVAADDLSDDDLHGVWLGAGLATQIGLALVDGPERFVTERTSPPAVPPRPPPSAR